LVKYGKFVQHKENRHSAGVSKLSFRKEIGAGKECIFLCSMLKSGGHHASYFRKPVMVLDLCPPIELVDDPSGLSVQGSSARGTDLIL